MGRETFQGLCPGAAHMPGAATAGRRRGGGSGVGGRLGPAAEPRRGPLSPSSASRGICRLSQQECWCCSLVAGHTSARRVRRPGRNPVPGPSPARVRGGALAGGALRAALRLGQPSESLSRVWTGPGEPRRGVGPLSPPSAASLAGGGPGLGGGNRAHRASHEKRCRNREKRCRNREKRWRNCEKRWRKAAHRAAPEKSPFGL